MDKEYKANTEERLYNLINCIEDARIKRVVEKFTSLDEYKTKRASGNHHTEIGGLIEHSLEVAENSIRLADYFECLNGVKLNKDFLIFGGLLHDIGKVQIENEECTMPSYYSHVAIGANMVYKELKNESFTDSEVEQLANIVLAHHSRIKREPNTPMYHSLEAYIIHICDSASAVITTGMNCIKNGAEVYTVYTQNEMRPAFKYKNKV